jgi:hypothetical protein
VEPLEVDGEIVVAREGRMVRGSFVDSSMTEANAAKAPPRVGVERTRRAPETSSETPIERTKRVTCVIPSGGSARRRSASVRHGAAGREREGLLGAEAAVRVVAEELQRERDFGRARVHQGERGRVERAAGPRSSSGGREEEDVRLRHWGIREMFEEDRADRVPDHRAGARTVPDQEDRRVPDVEVDPGVLPNAP